MLRGSAKSNVLSRKPIPAGSVLLKSEKLTLPAPTLEGSLVSPGYFSLSSIGANQCEDCISAEPGEKSDTRRGIIGNVMDIAGTIAGGAPGGSLVAGALQLTKWLSGIDDDGAEGYALYFSTILRSVKLMQEDIKANIAMVADTIAEQNFADLLLKLHVSFDLLHRNFISKLGNDLNTPEGLHLFIDACISPNHGILQNFGAMNRSDGPNSVASIISNLVNDSDFDPSGHGYLHKVHYDLAVAKYKALICAVNLYLASLHYEIQCMELINEIVDKNAWPDYMLATVNTYAPLSDIKCLLTGPGSLIAKLSTDVQHMDTSIAYVIQRRRHHMISLSDYNPHAGCLCSEIVYEFSDRRLPHPEFAGTLQVVTGRNHVVTNYKYTTDWWFPDHKTNQSTLEDIIAKRNRGFLQRGMFEENIKFLNPKGTYAAYSVPCGGYSLCDIYADDPDPLYWFVPGDLRFELTDKPEGPEVTRLPLTSSDWRHKYVQLYIDSTESAQTVNKRLEPLLKTSTGQDVTALYPWHYLTNL